jgi:hypothetical protein
VDTIEMDQPSLVVGIRIAAAGESGHAP